MDEYELVDRFKSFYGNLAEAEFAVLDRIYAPDVKFADPVHAMSGRQALHRYMEDLVSNVKHCRFEYLDQLILPSKAYVKWDMHYAHPKIGGGRTITLRGATQIEYNDAGIYYHEDFYDMGAMMYEHLPLIGRIIRAIKKRVVD